MPLHEYACPACVIRFERLYRTFSEVPSARDVACPRCEGPVRRLVSTASLAGHADVGVGRAAWPRSWEDTKGGDPEVLRGWRQRIERETRDEDRSPELVHLREANAVRAHEEQHGAGSAGAASRQRAPHTHGHSWTAVPFVAPTRHKP